MAADSDGLGDDVETDTGIYVSPADTGTDPYRKDSDGAGVGDWYEVAAIDANPADPQPNSPNDPAPNRPKKHNFGNTDPNLTENIAGTIGNGFSPFGLPRGRPC